MHQNAFGSWALPGPTGGAEAFPRPLAATNRRGDRKGEQKGGKGKEEEEQGKMRGEESIKGNFASDN